MTGPNERTVKSKCGAAGCLTLALLWRGVETRKERGAGGLHLVKIRKGGEIFPNNCLTFITVLSCAAIYNIGQTILNRVMYFLLHDKVIQKYDPEENIKLPVLSKSRNNT